MAVLGKTPWLRPCHEWFHSLEFIPMNKHHWTDSWVCGAGLQEYFNVSCFDCIRLVAYTHPGKFREEFELKRASDGVIDVCRGRKMIGMSENIQPKIDKLYAKGVRKVYVEVELKDAVDVDSC